MFLIPALFRRCCLMISALVSGLDGLGLRPGCCVLVLCSWARHFTLTVPLSTQVYKWILANVMHRVTLWWTNIPSRGGGGGRNTPSGFMPRKLTPAWWATWLIDFSFFTISVIIKKSCVLYCLCHLGEANSPGTKYAVPLWGTKFWR